MLNIDSAILLPQYVSKQKPENEMSFWTYILNNRKQLNTFAEQLQKIPQNKKRKTFQENQLLRWRETLLDVPSTPEKSESEEIRVQNPSTLQQSYTKAEQAPYCINSQLKEI